MKSANVSELKARLSSYLAEVKRGETVVVNERQTPIARLVPYDGDSEDFRVDEARGPVVVSADLRAIPLLQAVDVVELLRDDRDSR